VRLGDMRGEKISMMFLEQQLLFTYFDPNINGNQYKYNVPVFKVFKLWTANNVMGFRF